MRTICIMNLKGGVGKIIEYGGEGVKTLSVPERATITNMGAISRAQRYKTKYK